MEKGRRIVLFGCCLLLAISSNFCCCVSKRSSSAPAQARKEDIKCIKCEVCKAVAKQLSAQVAQQRKKVAPKQLSEYQIIEIAENVCSLKKSEGEWILHQDIVEEGDKLLLVEHEEEGECNTECKTIEKACQEVMDFHDTDIAEFIFKRNAQIGMLEDVICTDLTKACHGKIPPVPKDRAPGESFMPKSSKDAELERMMRSMSGMPGAPGMKVYSKDDLMRGMPNFGEDDEDEDEDDDGDDDDDDDEKTSKKKFVGAAKDVSLNKFVMHGQSIMNTVKDQAQVVIASIQKHIKDLSYRLWSWWSGKSKKGFSKPDNTKEL